MDPIKRLLNRQNHLHRNHCKGCKTFSTGATVPCLACPIGIELRDIGKQYTEERTKRRLTRQ